jgi:hypothetical protein
LIPVFFFRKKFWLYVSCSLTILIGTYIIKDKIETNHFEEVFRSSLKTGAPKETHTLYFITESGDTISHPPRPDKMFEPGVPPPGDMPKPIFLKAHMPLRFNFFSLYGLLLIFTASISVRFLQRWQEEEKRKSEIEKEKITTELNFLKQQINPHFLFNSLNSIYSLSISKSEKVTDSILKLSSILRYVLYESENKPVMLRDELSIISDYIELQKLRFTEKVSLTYRVIGEPERFCIEPFILIPLIENAFKYGVDSVNDTFISIVLKIDAEKLIMDVQNKIVFSNNDIHKKESGIGLRNIQRRLDLLYPNGYEFSAKASDDIFSVHLEVKHKL